MFTPSGRQSVKPVISDRYLEKIQKGGRPEIFRAMYGEKSGYVDGEPARHNSYQWDFVMDDGDFFKGGFAGQGLYISPSRNVVMVFFGTGDSSTLATSAALARAIAKSL